MIDIERVKEKFCKYSGEVMDETERGLLCAQLCEDCTEQVRKIIDSRGENPDESGTGAVESYAAALAFYQLVLSEQATLPKTFTADGVTVTQGENLKSAQAFLKSKRIAAAKYLGEEEFYFGMA